MPELVSPQRTHGLVDVLDRVLDKGLVIAGDIKINLANVELLTVQVRLLVCSIDKAEQIGLNWWRSDPRLTLPAGASGGESLSSAAVEQRLARLERQLEQLIARSAGSGTAPRAESATPPDALAPEAKPAASLPRPHHSQPPHPHGRP
jgi:Gas vesicle protein